MLCYIMLCYIIVCYVMLCYITLCYVMLFYVILFYVMLCYIIICIYYIKIDQKQLENVERFKYLGSVLTNDGRCECEIKSRITMAKAAFNQ